MIAKVGEAVEMSQGYIKLARCLLNKPLFQNEKLLKVWIWCLLKATHTGYEQLIGLQKIKLQPGQFIFGRDKAAEELRLPPSTVWRLMKFLKTNESLDIKTNNKFSLVTVINWVIYQVKPEKVDSETDNNWTTDEQQMDTNKNVKNDKKYIFLSEHAALAGRLKDQILINNRNAKVPEKLDAWANTIRLMMERDSRTVQDIEKVIDWCQRDNFWKSNILSADALRKQFDKLIMRMPVTTPKEDYSKVKL